MDADIMKPGRVLGGSYRIVRMLGEGGAGVVYAARHETLGHLVAIKVLFPQLARHAELRTRFIEEAQIQAQLRHPNLVAVVDIIDDGASLVASVLEFVEGRSLAAWLGKRHPVDQALALRIARGILGGLDFAHQSGIVHRDVKPDNVLLDLTGPEPVPRLTDFGIAKILAADKRTRTGTKMGTVAYMAPEQAEDSSVVDLRADIYSFGVTLYELLTGTLPFMSENVLVLMKQHAETPVPAPSLRRPDLWPGFEPILLRALQKNPADRFASCQALLEALDGVTDLAALPGGSASDAVLALPPTNAELLAAAAGVDELGDTAPHESVASSAPAVPPPPAPPPPRSAPHGPPPRRAPHAEGSSGPSGALRRATPRPEARTGSRSVTAAPAALGPRRRLWLRPARKAGWLLLLALVVYQVFPFGQCMWEVGEVYRHTRANADAELASLVRLDREAAFRIASEDDLGGALSTGAGLCLDRAGFGAGHPSGLNALLIILLGGLIALRVAERRSQVAPVLGAAERRNRTRAPGPPPAGERRRSRPPISVLDEGSAGASEQGRHLLQLDGAQSAPRGRDVYLSIQTQGLGRRDLAHVRVQARVEAGDQKRASVWDAPRPLTALLTAVPTPGDPQAIPFVVAWDDIGQALRRAGIELLAVRSIVVRVGHQSEGLLYRVALE